MIPSVQKPAMGTSIKCNKISRLTIFLVFGLDLSVEIGSPNQQTALMRLHEILRLNAKEALGEVFLATQAAMLSSPRTHPAHCGSCPRPEMGAEPSADYHPPRSQRGFHRQFL
jgi:hypothetical protein